MHLLWTYLHKIMDVFVVITNDLYLQCIRSDLSTNQINIKLHIEVQHWFYSCNRTMMNCQLNKVACSISIITFYWLLQTTIQILMTAKWIYNLTSHFPLPATIILSFFRECQVNRVFVNKMEGTIARRVYSEVWRNNVNIKTKFPKPNI